MTHDLAELQVCITSALDQYLPRQSDIAQPVVDAMRHAVLGGGKRLRPMLVCATCEALGSPVDRALPAACATEFIHAYSLIHDDLPAMDDDDIRHGLPSAHIAFGEPNAILAGDSLHSLAFQTIAGSEFHTEGTKLKKIELLSEAAGWSGMAGGQCLDITAEGQELTLDQLKTLHAAKTGALIRVSVLIGALAAEPKLPTSAQWDLLTRFGNKIGLAFQVMDDVLDVTQTTEKLGKPAGSDELLNKNTFPKLMGVNAATSLAHSLVAEAQSDLVATGLETGTLDQLARLVIERDY